MKVSIKTMAMLAMAAMMGLSSCKKEEEEGDVTIVSIKAGTSDLYGATTASGVASDADIVITFSSDVDASSVNGIMLMRGNTEADYDVTASGAMVTLSPSDDMATGTGYTLKISGVKSSGGKTASGATVEFTTEGVGLDTPPQKASQTMYLQFNGEVEDLTGNATAAFEQNSWTTDRFGNDNSAAYFAGATAAGNGDAIEMTGTDFVTASQTVSVWMNIDRSNPLASSIMPFGSASKDGFFLEVDREFNWFKYTTVHKVNPDPNSHLTGQAWTDVNATDNSNGERLLVDYEGDVSALIDGWFHLVMTFDASTYTKSLYVNGELVRQDKFDAGTTEWYLKDLTYTDASLLSGAIDKNLMIGFAAARGNETVLDAWGNYGATTQTFVGGMDDFRMYDVALTQSEVATLYNSEKAN